MLRAAGATWRRRDTQSMSWRYEGRGVGPVGTEVDISKRFPRWVSEGPAGMDSVGEPRRRIFLNPHGGPPGGHDASA